MTAALLAWPGAIAIGLSLGLFGSGGSVLTVPVLVYLFGQEEKVAIAGSLAIVGTIAAVGAVPYARDRLIEWRSVVAFGLPGMAGTYLGAGLAAYVAGIVQLALFACVMLLAAALMLRPPRLDASAAEPRAIYKIVIDGLLVGILTGLVGVGGGFLIVPALVLLGGLPIQRAVGTSLLIIALKSASGFVKYLDVLEAERLELDWLVLGAVTVLGIAGSFGGSLLANRLPAAQLTRGFGWFLVVMGVVILTNSVRQMLGG